MDYQSTSFIPFHMEQTNLTIMGPWTSQSTKFVISMALCKTTMTLCKTKLKQSKYKK